MANRTIPYLCGGTFFVQILRARKDLTTSIEHTNGKKEALSESETFRRLISIYHLSDFDGGTSLKTYTNTYKTCKDSLVNYGKFADYDTRRAFDEDTKSDNSTALYMMKEFVEEFIKPEKYVQLVRSLLGMIEEDTGIQPDDEFFITGDAVPVEAGEICDLDCYYIEPFLLGVWYYIIMHRAKDNEKGEATYKEWYPRGISYMGTVGDEITRKLRIESMPTRQTRHNGAVGDKTPGAKHESEADTHGEEKQRTHAGKDMRQINNQTVFIQNGPNGTQIEYVENLTIG